jgi:hypothetical protein
MAPLANYLKRIHQIGSSEQQHPKLTFFKRKRKKRKLTFDVERNSSRPDFSLQLKVLRVHLINETATRPELPGQVN